MFKIGDKVVYPMHGTGIIQAMEEKEFLGEKQHYYIIKMLSNNMKIMIPIKKIATSNLRRISDLETLNKALLSFNNKIISSDEVSNPKQRHQNNMERFKSGSLKESAEVVYELMQINKEKELNSSDKQMLTNAKKFLIDEIVLIKSITESEAEELLNSLIN